MTAPFKVLKVPGSDGNPVLIQVTSKGNNPLDVKLVGTEGSAAYRVTLKRDRVASLRVKNCPVSESEWEDILQSLFQVRPLADIQATATVEPDTSIAITVRKIIQGTTHRLGAITLNYTESEEIGLFEWCAAAIDTSIDGGKALAGVEAQKEALEADVKEYKRQLDELIQAKNDDETVLLQKFRDLLNEKKLKIREQQKIISAASFPDGAPESPEAEDSPQPTRKAAASRAGKRKAAAKDAQDADETPDAEDMDVDPIKVEAEDTDPGNTTDGTASTADEDEDNDEDVQPRRSAVSQPSAPASKPSAKESEKPPPPRSLPFNQKKPVAKATAKAQSDTDSEDDEL